MLEKLSSMKLFLLGQPCPWALAYFLLETPLQRPRRDPKQSREY